MANVATIGFMLVLFLVFTSFTEETFDVRQHLSTVTRYEFSKDIKENTFVPSNISDECSPIHLNLVARHGTRYPTEKRIRDLDTLSDQLKVLLQNAEDEGLSLEKVPSWFRGWRSPWKGTNNVGELTKDGEHEMYHLGIRIWERFKEPFRSVSSENPATFQITATQIPRALASAKAFRMGMFSGREAFGMGMFSGREEPEVLEHRASVIVIENRTRDRVLGFHDICQDEKANRKHQEAAVYKHKEPVLDNITRSLAERYGLNFTVKDISTLWFLCKQEASLLNITDQACGLFSEDEVKLLERTDDLEMFMLRGYGNSRNYQIGMPLLEDVISSMEQAIKANEGDAPGSYAKAKLRFAHAETLVPFSCLIGLFLEGSEFEQIQRGEALEFAPKPPSKRNWRGSTVAPFAGNIVLVLYSCPSVNDTSNYFVQVLQNEQPIPMAGCGDTDFCPFEVFKEIIAAPHLKHSY